VKVASQGGGGFSSGFQSVWGRGNQFLKRGQKHWMSWNGGIGGSLCGLALGPREVRPKTQKLNWGLQLLQVESRDFR